MQNTKNTKYRNQKKGFVITLVTLALVSLLLVFATALHNGYLSMERAIVDPQALMYTSFLFDSVAHDTNNIAGPEILITQTSGNAGIWISDSVPGENYSSKLSEYEDFLETTFANQAHATINADFSNMSSDSLVLTINENYVYRNNISTSEVFFSSNEESTDAMAYYINITVLKIREELAGFTFDPDGDMNVTVRYTDYNGTYEESGTVYSNQINTFQADYADGEYMELNAGSKNSKYGTLWIQATENTTASFSYYVVLPAQEEDDKINYKYNATLDYVQGKISMNRAIGK
ncbi:hypothetical protein KKF81_05020 [Candidatus Micrarchaeota archaeon]|nr:hypothetical protein [Candidatus Micrarchaeota archaeon]MBU1166288.1 hypothetical protein [Candidatus Micrarchaeota archaeon]MBU1886265.1 hypothetical protein [Candidatus Micrarchaeota archaeon]